MREELLDLDIASVGLSSSAMQHDVETTGISENFRRELAATRAETQNPKEFSLVP